MGDSTSLIGQGWSIDRRKVMKEKRKVVHLRRWFSRGKKSKWSCADGFLWSLLSSMQLYCTLKIIIIILIRHHQLVSKYGQSVTNWRHQSWLWLELWQARWQTLCIITNWYIGNKQTPKKTKFHEPVVTNPREGDALGVPFSSTTPLVPPASEERKPNFHIGKTKRKCWCLAKLFCDNCINGSVTFAPAECWVVPLRRFE